MNFTALTLVISQFIDFAWNVLLGLLIFGIGLWLAGWIAGAMEASSMQQKRLAVVFVRNRKSKQKSMTKARQDHNSSK